MLFENLPPDFSLCRDAVFKAVFTKDTPESRGALSGLISAFIGRKITSVSVINNEPAVDDMRQRQIRYDLNATFDNGELANIEVMLYPNAHEPERMEYYLDRLHASQEIKGTDKTFADLKRTWQLSIADRKNFFADNEYFHNFILYDPIRHISLGGLTAVHTLELNKLDGVLKKPVSEMSSLERWSIYFKYFTDPEKQGLLQEILKEEEAITMATQVIQGLTQSQIEYIREMSRHKREADYWQSLRDAKDEGRAEGETRGKALGRAEGEAKVLNLLKKAGYDTTKLEEALKTNSNVMK
jgi:predicted transposase/invertase (TIGR01784 family)